MAKSNTTTVFESPIDIPALGIRVGDRLRLDPRDTHPVAVVRFPSAAEIIRILNHLDALVAALRSALPDPPPKRNGRRTRRLDIVR